MTHELSSIPFIALIPFILMLACIAIMPLAYNHFWENNRNKLIIGLVLSIPIVVYLPFAGLASHLEHTLLFDYVPFIILLGALFLITGGIHVSGDIEAKPKINTLFLAIGAVLASVMGTTGASMLLIRPLIQTNAERHNKVHTILFFIGIVSNCGGLLTPLGDPPLFMLYLRGAPFSWFFQLFPEWIFANLLLLIVFFFVDSYYYNRETRSAKLDEKTIVRPIRVFGTFNFLFLLGVVLSVAFINEQYFPALGANPYLKFVREGIILILALASYFLTPQWIHQSNNFSWTPIEEVAYLFLGIFITMTPCILYLEGHAATLGIASPTQFYYMTGLLSAILDNTPTAVTFYSLALGLGEQAASMVAGVPEITLKSISTGAVFFGAMTYIGNGPNFMVKAVAEENGIEMPHFFSYIYKFSLIVLLPIFILVHLFFL